MNYHKTKYSQLLNCDIDENIIELIESINILDCKTFESCQGGIDEEKEYELAFVILERKHFLKVKHLFPKDISIEIGDGGYMLSDYSSDLLEFENLLYITFKV